MSAQQPPKSLNSSSSDLNDSTDNVSAGNKLGERGRSDAAPGKATAFPRLGEHDFLVEDRFGELDRRDSVPAESRDLGHLGPIVREVGDKLKHVAHKVADVCHCASCTGKSAQKKMD